VYRTNFQIQQQMTRHDSCLLQPGLLLLMLLLLLLVLF
jgi:hypothetical protein